MGCPQSSVLYEEKIHDIPFQLGPRPSISEEHVSIVTETWSLVKRNISQVGVVLFLRLFEKHPDVQNLFVHFRGLSSDELRSSERLRDHGLKVMNTVDKCIARLDRVDKLEKLLYELGQKHVIYNIKIEYLDLIVPQLQQAIIPALGDRWTYLVESAWSSFLRYITHIMAESMLL